MDSLTQEIKVEDSAKKTVSGDLDILGGKTDSKFDNVIAIVEQGSGKKIREVIRDKIQQKRIEDQEKKDVTYCLRQIQLAYSKLESADSSLDENSELSGIEDLLVNIEIVVDSIRDWVVDASNSD